MVQPSATDASSSRTPSTPAETSQGKSVKQVNSGRQDSAVPPQPTAAAPKSREEVIEDALQEILHGDEGEWEGDEKEDGDGEEEEEEIEIDLDVEIEIQETE